MGGESPAAMSSYSVNRDLCEVQCNDMPFQKACREFKKQYMKSGIITDLKKRKVAKPSDRRRAKARVAERRRLTREKRRLSFKEWQSRKRASN